MAKKVSVKTMRDLVKKDKGVEIVEFSSVEMELKKYLPINDKRMIIELVVENAFIEKDGIRRVDPAIKEVMVSVLLVKYYANINEFEDLYEMYDVIKSSGLLDFVKNNIPENELDLLETLIEDRISEEYYAIKQEGSFIKVAENFISMINNKMQEGIKEIENFDPEKLKKITEVIQKVSNKVDDIDG